MLVKLVLAGFLLAHAAIHASFLARPPASVGGPAWPFELGRSWILSPLGLGASTTRLLGIALVAAILAGYALAAVAALGWIPVGLFVGGVVAASVASLGLLLVFFHPWLVLGVALDLALLWAVLVAAWRPEGLPG